MAIERTLVILKPDAVERRLVGQVLARFERLDLELERIELRIATAELIDRHYPNDDGWLSTVGGKTLDDYERQGIDPAKGLGTESALEIGRIVKGWLVEFMTSGPIVVCVIAGNRAVETVRKVVGSTLPTAALPGTIRGDFSVDSPDLANSERRPVRNLIHASGTVSEADAEISLWFPTIGD